LRGSVMRITFRRRTLPCGHCHNWRFGYGPNEMNPVSTFAVRGNAKASTPEARVDFGQCGTCEDAGSFRIGPGYLLLCRHKPTGVHVSDV
jgi:hypothetical protein